MIVIPTVQHTGSLFVVNHLFGGRKNVIFRHFGQPAFQQLYPYIDGRNCIIPLRELNKVIESWAGRQSNPDHLDRDIGLMVEFAEKYNPYFLPIDHPERQSFLDVINKDFNLDLKTDWPVINNQKHRPVDDDFSKVKRHQWFFDKIYQ